MPVKTEKKNGKLYVEIEVWSWRKDGIPPKAASTSNPKMVEDFTKIYGHEPKHEIMKFEHVL
jgi:hypothetical protein